MSHPWQDPLLHGCPADGRGPGSWRGHCSMYNDTSFQSQLWPRMGHLASPNPSDFIWKTTLLDQTAGLKLGSCSSLETPGDKWTDRASGLPSLAREGPELPSRKLSFAESVPLLQKGTVKAMKPEMARVPPAQGGITPCNTPGGTCQSSNHTETEQRLQGPLQRQQEEGHRVFWCSGGNLNGPPLVPLSSLYTSRTNPPTGPGPS